MLAIPKKKQQKQRSWSAVNLRLICTLQTCQLKDHLLSKGTDSKATQKWLNFLDTRDFHTTQKIKGNAK